MQSIVNFISGEQQTYFFVIFDMDISIWRKHFVRIPGADRWMRFPRNGGVVIINQKEPDKWKNSTKVKQNHTSPTMAKVLCFHLYT